MIDITKTLTAALYWEVKEAGTFCDFEYLRYLLVIHDALPQNHYPLGGVHYDRFISAVEEEYRIAVAEHGGGGITFVDWCDRHGILGE